MDIADAATPSRALVRRCRRAAGRPSRRPGRRPLRPRTRSPTRARTWPATCRCSRPAARADGFEHLVYASSSSVYGERRGRAARSRRTTRLGRPTSLYAATKQADELMSEAYAHLYGLPQTGLRFFTVYGPWGRPDMAYYAFTRDDPGRRADRGVRRRRARARLHLHRRHSDGLIAVLDRPPDAPRHRVLNIGAGRPRRSAALVEVARDASWREGEVVAGVKPAGDVTATFADVRAHRADRLRTQGRAWRRALPLRRLVSRALRLSPFSQRASSAVDRRARLVRPGRGA